MGTLKEDKELHRSEITVAVVTPVGNERNYIDRAIEQMRSVIQKCKSYEIVWLLTSNDFCTDGTYEYLSDLSCKSGFEWIHVVKVDNTKALAHAYIAGYAAALQMGFDLIVEADVGHPYHYLPLLFDGLNDAPVVFGTRYGRKGDYKGPLTRKLLSKAGTWAGRLLLGFPMSDGTSGFQGFRREVLEQIPLYEFISTGHIFQTEMKRYCCKLDFMEIEYPYRSGQSSLSFKSITEAILLLFRLMTIRPLNPESIPCNLYSSCTFPKPAERQ